MASMNKHIKILKITIVLFMPYIFQFILLPLIFPDIRGDGIGYAANIFNLIFPIIGMAFLTDKLRYWLLSDFAWFILSIIYHPPGIYGIGLRINIVGPNIGSIIDSSEIPTYDGSSAWFALVIFVIANFLVQFAVWICFKIFKAVKAHLKKKKAEA